MSLAEVICSLFAMAVVATSTLLSWTAVSVTARRIEDKQIAIDCADQVAEYILAHKIPLRSYLVNGQSCVVSVIPVKVPGHVPITSLVARCGLDVQALWIVDES